MAKHETITLVGGPGDGMQVTLEAADVVRWAPTDERELITTRTMGRPPVPTDPILYVRSRRTRNLFVYQP